MNIDKAFADIETLSPGTKVEHKDHKGRMGAVVLDNLHLCKNGEVLVRFSNAEKVGKFRITDLIVIR